MKALLLATLALLVVACGNDASAAELGGTLKYARSGGIAGISERATVKTDGHVTVSGRKRRTRTARLTGAERQRLSRLVRAADLAHVKVDGKSECCDQFEYSLSYRGRTLQWSDAHFPKPLGKLVAELNDLVVKYGGGPG
jgi:emfourin